MKTVTLEEGHSVYKDEQINQLLSELDDLRTEKENIIHAVRELKKIMPFNESGSIDPMKIMGVVSALQQNPKVTESMSFLGKYM